ncbi:MAG: ligase-associated DNA damage response endonuclease PdeM [Balneolaceae bacterium]|nr:ligase-associated DNA damage response endonuclease PdeM [Balneolaceae bacterium]
MDTMKDFSISISGQTFVLLAEKAMFWKEEQMLIISDVHLGKAGHFRKHGIALPSSSNENNLHRIDELIQQRNPKTLLFLGDLFHSEKNAEWNSFKEWRQQHKNISFKLVMGNHEIYPTTDYELLGIECYSHYQKSDILFVHDENDIESTSEVFCISGHIHPAIRLKGKGRQSLRFPCFYKQNTSMFMPAFGNLTGTHTVNPRKGDLIIATIDNHLLRIQ